MLFKRKIPPGFSEKLRVALWPRRSWGRSLKYMVKRVMRLTGSPHAIAAGVAAGVFASFTPFMGLHFLIAFAIAYFIAGNFLAAAMGTFFGNPLSFPFIWASTYTTGTYILTGSSSAAGMNPPDNGIAQLAESGWFELGLGGVWDIAIGIWDPVLKPMLIGAFPLGIPVSITAYILTRWGANKFRDARRRKLARVAAAQ